MALLWTKAMAWHNDDRTDEHENATGEYGFRDTRPYEQRRPELIKHIAFVHDVPEHRAEHALSLVEQGYRDHLHMTSPEHYGLKWGRREPADFPEHVVARAYSQKEWESDRAKEEDVPLKDVHTTQSWVRHDGVAHNLFHPGMRAPEEDGVEGDPDYDPDWDSDRHAEADALREQYPEDYGPGSNHITRLPRFLRYNGTTYSVDGHHRLAADSALGKTHTRGLVIQHSGRSLKTRRGD